MSSPAMKWVLYVVLATVGVGLVLTASFLAVEQGGGWEQLPDGSKTRVFAVTQGTRHQLTFPTRSWDAHIRKILSRPLSPSLVPQLVQRERGWTGDASTTPSTVVWFQSDASGVVTFDATLVTADGRRFRTAAANGATTDGYAYSGLKFPVVPSEATLHLEMTINRKPVSMDVPAPAVRKP